MKTKASESFRLAPMSPVIRWLTVGLFLLPAGFFYGAWQSGQSLVFAIANAVLGIYAFVWLYMRPGRFEISASALTLVWPLRRDSIPLAGVRGVEVLGADEFHGRFGWGMRVGAGGLWGGFGLLITRGGKLRFYISRVDRFVLVESVAELPLLITPSEPDRFVRVLRQRLGSPELP